MRIKYIPLCLLLLMLTGCTHTVITKTYSDGVWKVESEPTVFFLLEPGRDDSRRGETVFGDPYRLRALFSIDSKYKELSLIGLSLTGSDGMALKIENIVKDLTVFKNETGSASVQTLLGKLKHQQYRLTGEVIFKDEVETKGYSIDLFFEPKFKQKKVNRIWNNLMSI